MQITKDITKVYIDFDDTLCNTLLTSGFAEGYFEFLARITNTSVEKIYETLPNAILDIRKTGFPVYNTLAHVALFSSNDHSKEIEEYIRINIASYVFKDSKPFLTALKVAGKKVCILSYGDNWFQKLKITHCGLAQLVDEVVVVQGDKLSYIKRRTPDGEKPLIIDDKLISFEHSTDYPDITCVLIDRERKNDSVDQYHKINSFFDVEFAIL
jgi:FMN phosphatase YigB (HAD superfamily)